MAEMRAAAWRGARRESVGDQARVEVSRGSVLLSMEWSCCLDPKLDRRLDEEPVRDDPLRRIAKTRERRRLERGSFLLGHGLRRHCRRSPKKKKKEKISPLFKFWNQVD